MAENYPENMTELNKQYFEEQKRDPTITKQQLIRRAVANAFQDFLSEAEEGHYDSGKLVGNEIQVFGINQKLRHVIKPMGTSFESDFEKDGAKLMWYLEERANKAIK